MTLLFEVYTSEPEGVVVEAAQHVGFAVARIMGLPHGVVVEVNGQTVLDGDGEVSERMRLFPLERYPVWPRPCDLPDAGDWWSHEVLVTFRSRATRTTLIGISVVLGKMLQERAARTGTVNSLLLSPDLEILAEEAFGRVRELV